MNELTFAYGALLRNIHDKSREWSIGDHRGDKQKYFKRNCIRILTRDELSFVNTQVCQVASFKETSIVDTSSLNVLNREGPLSKRRHIFLH